jgi:hypothetical protein
MKYYKDKIKHNKNNIEESNIMNKEKSKIK